MRRQPPFETGGGKDAGEERLSGMAGGNDSAEKILPFREVDEDCCSGMLILFRGGPPGIPPFMYTCSLACTRKGRWLKNLSSTKFAKVLGVISSCDIQYSPDTL